jgi:hypothetical protein
MFGIGRGRKLLAWEILERMLITVPFPVIFGTVEVYHAMSGAPFPFLAHWAAPPGGGTSLIFPDLTLIRLLLRNRVVAVDDSTQDRRAEYLP